MAPEVTIVVSTHDRWLLLARTSLRAARLQEDVDVDVVVVDDGSAEPPPADLPGLEDERVRVVQNPGSQGIAAARNTGIREARGEWVAFLDDDDVWSPWKLRAQLDAARRARADFAYSGAVWVDQALQLVHGHAPPRPETLGSELLRWNVLWGGGSNVVARRALLLELGGFDETLFQLADWDAWIRLALAGAAAAVDEVHVGLLVHRESMLLVDRRDVFAELDRLAEKHAPAARLDRARFARWVAAGHLRAGRRREAARAYVRDTRAPGNVLRAGGAFLGPKVFAGLSRARAVVPGALGAGERVAERPDWLDRYR